jgi:hypothetical protein
MRMIIARERAAHAGAEVSLCCAAPSLQVQ